MAPPTEIVAFLPIDLSSAALTITTANGIANSHVTMLGADVFDGPWSSVGKVIMQTRPEGDYTLVFVSTILFTKHPQGNSLIGETVFSKMWMTCHAAAPELSVRTCDYGSGIVSVTRSSTISTTSTEPILEISETYTMSETTGDVYSTPESTSVLMTMSDHMKTLSVNAMLRRRTSTAEESKTTTAPDEI